MPPASDPRTGKFCRVVRAAALVITTLLVAPALGSLDGGADLDVGRWALEWFDAVLAPLALAGAAGLTLLRPADPIRGRIGGSLALVGFALSAMVFWTGGFKAEWLSISHAKGPVVAGWLGMALLVLRVPSRAHWVSVKQACSGWIVAGALGGVILLLCVELDARELAARIPSRPGSQGGDVVVIVTDTLRADALRSYGGDSTTTPFLDGLVRESVVFDLALAQAPWTVPSMASLMSGLFPSTLDASGASWDGYEELYRFPPGVARLAQRYQQAGYHTAGFVKNAFLGEASGFAEGFDIYQHVSGDPAEEESGAQLARAVTRWAKVFAERRRAGETQPFFLYVHFMEPHSRYMPPRRFVPPETRSYQGPFDGKERTVTKFRKEGGVPTDEDNAFLWALYSGEVDYLDHVLARMEREFSQLGLWSEQTALVFTADHGEQFGEHGEYFHHNLQIENLHVPLLIRHPALAPGRVEMPVRVIDVAPTLIELTGLAPLEHADGRSLLPAMRRDAQPALPAVSEYQKSQRITELPYALIVTPDGVSLYDLERDPKETRDLAAEQPAVVARLRARLDEHLQRERLVLNAPEGAPVPIDPDTRRALEAIGYVQE